MSYSKSIQTRLVLLRYESSSFYFGGKVLAYIDEIAAIAAMKHSQGEVVTASFDSVDFVSPAYAGYDRARGDCFRDRSYINGSICTRCFPKY